MLRDFFDFLKTYGIIGLAIAVVIGGKLNEFVSIFVQDLLMPAIFMPVLKAARLDDIRQLNYNGILYGRVLGAFVDFLIVAFLVFIFAKFVLKEEQITKK